MSAQVRKDGDDDNQDEGDDDEDEGCAQAVMTWAGRSVRALETLLRPICSNQRWDPHCGDPPQSASTWKVPKSYLESSRGIPECHLM